MQYDVIILGAGPAGSLTACLCARAGLATLVLEKSDWPRYKACGGALSARSTAILCSNNIKLPPAIIQKKINDFKFYFSEEEKFSLNYSGQSIKLVQRTSFDNFLLKQAVAAGAEFRSSVKIIKIEQNKNSVKLFSTIGELQSSYLVGADGANSKLRKIINPELAEFYKFKGSAIEAELPVNQSLPEELSNEIRIDFANLQGGYAWSFPKRNEISIGLGSMTFQKLALKEVLFAYLNQLGVSYNPENIFFRGHPIPVYKTKNKFKRSRQNIILVGDAAFLADSFIGEGIYSALASAELAAEILITKYKNKQFDLRDYEKKLADNLFAELEAAAHLAALFYRAKPLVKNIIKQRPDLLEAFMDAVQGKKSYQELTKLFNFLKLILRK
ncbi:geranylgeranyl reductase family protein [Halanaerobium salsuginis]|uniref:Geranylgeranyl reductase family n=1 Tax=Halanaerobium salsuginis TaxID=29563 RepID=A0A1I4H4C3_9FIRM|nr:geranylgeranyl reductase family protein [Halanaerobium salsuginis]SFL36497.1 geranylgeranyl reductase family [Halanaerobium salsuginis]